jgi:uncharacterized integral membrane protein (TIGR00697 family)
MFNETLFLLTAFAIFSFIFCCFFLGRRWLHAAIAVNLIAISFFGAEVVSIFGKITNVGNIFYVAVFFAGQLLAEHYGRKEADRSIGLGFAYVVFVIVVGQIIVRYVPTPESVKVAESIKALFVFTPRIALASLLAYLCSQSINIWLYSYIGKLRKKEIWLRSIVSNLVGQFLDSIIFFSVAFLGVLSQGQLVEAMTTGFWIKFLLGLFMVPLLYLSYRLKTNKGFLEQEAQAVTDVIGDGVVMTDRDGKIILVNKAFEEMMGWSYPEVAGKFMTDVIERQDEAGNKIRFEERILTRVLAGEKVLTSMTNHSYFVRKNKTRFPVSILATPVTIDQRVMGAVEVFRDVTEEKEIEKLRTDFLSLASHQLRTPLSGTRWIIETLQKGTLGELNPKQKEYVDNLYKVNKRLTGMVSDMLNILHIQSGTVKIKKTTFALNNLFKEVETILEPVAKNQQVSMEINRGEDSALTLSTDFELAKSILEALVANAIGYSNPGSTVLLSAVDSPAGVIFSVKDSGIGIPANEQKRIFERFYRASNAQRVKTDGTGLGLYTAHVLAEKIGVEITFESEEGKGSTFHLRIPK